MYGPREVVAKAVALECMRGAHRQQRRCYLYSFRWAGSRLGWLLWAALAPCMYGCLHVYVAAVRTHEAAWAMPCQSKLKLLYWRHSMPMPWHLMPCDAAPWQTVHATGHD